MVPMHTPHSIWDAMLSTLAVLLPLLLLLLLLLSPLLFGLSSMVMVSQQLTPGDAVVAVMAEGCVVVFAVV